MRWVLVVLSLLVMPEVWAAQLRDLRLWDGPEATRVVFDLNADVSYKYFTLDNPKRVVIDIDGLAREDVGRIANTQGAGVVQQVRSGPRGGAVRVVLDIAQSVFVTSFKLPAGEDYGHRLVFDLASPDAASAAQTPIPPAAPPVVPRQTVRVEDKPIVIAIDAGHGGEDPGARGRTGLNEKDVALSISRKLAKLINDTPNMRAVLTRDGDYYVGLRERVNIARKHEADLFVSVHCNAFTKRELRGSAVYVLSDRGATSEHARWLAHKENSADLVGGVDLHDKDNELAAVLIDLSQGATMEASFDVASRILNSVGQINRLQKSEIQQAGFAVLKAPDIPSVLVETAFITNAQEEKLLASGSFQTKLAKQIFDGVTGYFHSYRPRQQIVERDDGLRKVSYAGGAGTTTQGVSH